MKKSKKGGVNGSSSNSRKLPRHRTWALTDARLMDCHKLDEWRTDARGFRYNKPESWPHPTPFGLCSLTPSSSSSLSSSSSASSSLSSSPIPSRGGPRHSPSTLSTLPIPSELLPTHLTFDRSNDDYNDAHHKNDRGNPGKEVKNFLDALQHPHNPFDDHLERIPTTSLPLPNLLSDPTDFFGMPHVTPMIGSISDCETINLDHNIIPLAGNGMMPNDDINSNDHNNTFRKGDPSFDFAGVQPAESNMLEGWIPSTTTTPSTIEPLSLARSSSISSSLSSLSLRSSSSSISKKKPITVPLDDDGTEESSSPLHSLSLRQPWSPHGCK
jgi:hypothetical protein